MTVQHRTNKKKSRLTLQKKTDLVGLVFVLPFIIGVFGFFLVPIIQSIIYTFNKLTFAEVGGFDLEFIGLENYREALLRNGGFNRVLVDTLIGTLSRLPFILFFSYFIALILNQKFKGRLLARVILFLPVIMSANIILKMEQTDFMMGVMSGIPSSEANQTGMGILMDLLIQTNIPEDFLNYIVSGIENSASIIKQSSIQILIFLSALQGIPANLYEASNVEGATAWENFWKITFPIMLPTLLINTVYTIIDAYAGQPNGLIEFSNNIAMVGGGFGLSSTMNWIYLLCNAVILAIVFAILSKKTAQFEES